MDVAVVLWPGPCAEVSCEGLQVALPAAMFRAGHAAAPTLTCDKLQLTMADDGLRISFKDGALQLCPGCFLVRTITINKNPLTAISISPSMIPDKTNSPLTV